MRAFGLSGIISRSDVSAVTMCRGISCQRGRAVVKSDGLLRTEMKPSWDSSALESLRSSEGVAPERAAGC